MLFIFIILLKLNIFKSNTRKIEVFYFDTRDANRHCFHGFRENATNKFMNFIEKEKQIDESKNESYYSEKNLNEQNNNITNTNSNSKYKLTESSKKILFKKESFSNNNMYNFNDSNYNEDSLNRNQNEYFSSNLNFKNIVKRNESNLRRESFICNKPLKCFSDGRTHSFSDIFERKSSSNFPTMKVNAETLKKCFALIGEEKNKKENIKIKNMFEQTNKNGEIEIPDLQYLGKVKKRVKKIVKNEENKRSLSKK